MVRKLAVVLLGSSLMAPAVVNALGLGEYEVHSYLNQPFDMNVELIQTRDLSPEEIRVTLAPQDAFELAGVERLYFLTDLRFEVQESSTGQLSVHIKSRKPVAEPFLDFIIEVHWPAGRARREYTLLMDPPAYAQQFSSGVSAPVVSTQTQAPVTVAPTQAAAVQTNNSQTTNSAATAPVSAQQVAAPVSNSADNSQSSQAAANDYTVDVGDTMWAIALKNRPSQSVSVQQTMMAIQRLNDEAFIGGNINLLRKGQVLRMPTEADIRAVQTRDAIKQVAEQNRAWEGLLKKKGIAIPRSGAPLTGQRGNSHITDNASASQGQVTLVSESSAESSSNGSAAGSAASGEATQNRLAVIEESLDETTRKNSQLTGRVGELEQQVQTSDRLLDLKNDQISQLQAELAKLREAQAAGVASQAAAEVAEVALTEVDEAAATEMAAIEAQMAENAAALEAQAEQAGEVAAEELPVDGTQVEAVSDASVEDVPAGDVAADSVDVAASSEAEATEVVATTDVAINEPVVVEEPKSFVEEHFIKLVAGGVTLILFIIAGLALARRKNTDDSLDVYTGEGLSDGGDIDDFDGIDDLGLDLDDAEDEAPALDQDPVEQADVYIAYGDFDQAKGFLLTAVVDAPERTDLKLKLAEVAAELNDSETFEAQADALSDDDDAMNVIAGLRSKLGGGADEEDMPSLDDLALDLTSDLDSLGTDSDDFSDETLSLDLDADNVSLDLSEELSSDDAEDELGLDLAETDSDDELSLDIGDDAGLDDGLNLDVEEDELSLDVDTLGADDELSLDLNDLDSGDEISLDLGSLDSDDELSLDVDTLGSDDELSLDLDSLGDDDELSLDSDDELSLDLNALGDDDLSLDVESLTESSDLDDEFDLSLGDDEPTLVGGAALSDADIDAAGTEQREELTLDDELSLDDDLGGSFDAELESLVDEEAETVVSSPMLTDEMIAESEVDLDAELEVDLDLTADITSEAEESDGLDLAMSDDLSDDLDLDAELAELDGDGSDDLDLDDGDDFDFLADADENATKLDLAKAYIDMGDADGAKDILGEVLQEGSEGQKTEAQQLMDQVS